jgi:hypothetical protein
MRWRRPAAVCAALAAVIGAGASCGASGGEHGALPTTTVTVTVAATGAATSPPPSPASSPSPEGPASFAATIAPIDSQTRAAMRASGSWQPDCPVRIGDLRLVTLSYWGFDDVAHTGHLIVHRSVAADVVRAMRLLYRARFPIRRMELVDAYDADDDRSMAADNTSAFNARKVEGSDTWSEHAYGLAIDIDPRENPMIADGEIFPPAGAAFRDRTLEKPGMIHRHDAVFEAFAAIGWEWGGDWHSLKDYQHFSLRGR